MNIIYIDEQGNVRMMSEHVYSMYIYIYIYIYIYMYMYLTCAFLLWSQEDYRPLHHRSTQVLQATTYPKKKEGVICRGSHHKNLIATDPGIDVHEVSGSSM